MPGRVATKSTRLAPKARSSARTASPISDIPDEGESTSLREQICAIFGQAHRSTTGSRKLVVGLRKVQEACCYEPAQPRKNASHEEFAEEDFNAEVVRCVTRVLQVKKSEPAGDRLVKFLGSFLKYAAESDYAIFQQEDPDTFPETPTSRLSSQTIALLLPLLPAKDKIIRFRCTQIIAYLINTLDSIDDELFHPIRLGLLRRLRDKESNIRAQAVYGLGRLASEVPDGENDDEDDSDDDGAAGGVLEKLLDVLQNDPSAEVRRSLLLNLPFTPTTLPFLLERARDSDAAIRRALYSRLLPALADFRHLSLTHREKLLRWGLRDRDDAVKKAAARLFRERWIEDCARTRDSDEPADPKVVSDPSFTGLLELLERIDVVNAGVDGGIALDAMKEFWDGRPDYREYVSFDEAFWKDLSSESVFVARTFNDFCRRDGVSDGLREKMPEVTRFAFLLQENVNRLVETVRRCALQEDTEEDTIQQEFIVEQLLHIALTLDYSDEIGRRTMFSLLREALALAELPEEATKLVTQVLRTASGRHSGAEKEFSAVILEAIAEVHDTIMGEEPKQDEEADDSFHSAKSELSDDTPKKGGRDDGLTDEERAVREIMVNMKCLHIAQCMLQNVERDLDQNVDLVTMLNNLVIPAVRSQEAPIRERGLLCLGLCCLLDKNLAEENLTLFIHCFTKGHEALQNIAIQIIGDILSAHPSLLAQTPTTEENVDSTPQEHPLYKPIHKLFSKALQSPSAPIQSTACTALCKLMLSSPSAGISSGNSTILNHDELLKLVTIAYFDPETAGNPALRQGLTYFLPVYCHSRTENMERMGRIAADVLHWCVSAKEEMDVDDDDASGEMVGLSVVVAHLVDWTDGRKLAAALSGIGEGHAEGDNGRVHLDLGEEILEKVLGVSSKEERKIYISMLGKLHIPSTSPASKLERLSAQVQEALDDNKVATDATTRNTLTKVQTALAKATDAGSKPRPTVALSTTGDGDDDAQTMLDEDEEDARAPSILEDDEQDTTILPTPAPSPQKKARGTAAAKPKPSAPSRRTHQAPTPAPSTADSEQTPSATPAPKSPQKKPAPARAKRAATTKKQNGPPPPPLQPEQQEEEPPLSETESTTMTEDMSTLTIKQEPLDDDDNDSDTPRPARKTRGKNPVAVDQEMGDGDGESTVVDPSEDGEGESTILQSREVVGVDVEPVRKARGRPPKGGAVGGVRGAAAAAAPPRKSVRSGRKKAVAVVDAEEEGGSLVDA